MLEIVATIVVTSQPNEWQLTATPTTCAKMYLKGIVRGLNLFWTKTMSKWDNKDIFYKNSAIDTTINNEMAKN